MPTMKHVFSFALLVALASVCMTAPSPYYEYEHYMEKKIQPARQRSVLEDVWRYIQYIPGEIYYTVRNLPRDVYYFFKYLPEDIYYFFKYLPRNLRYLPNDISRHLRYFSRDIEYGMYYVYRNFLEEYVNNATRTLDAFSEGFQVKLAPSTKELMKLGEAFLGEAETILYDIDKIVFRDVNNTEDVLVEEEKQIKQLQVKFKELDEELDKTEPFEGGLVETKVQGLIKGLRHELAGDLGEMEKNIFLKINRLHLKSAQTRELIFNSLDSFSSVVGDVFQTIEEVNSMIFGKNKYGLNVTEYFTPRSSRPSYPSNPYGRPSYPSNPYGRQHNFDYYDEYGYGYYNSSRGNY